MWIISVTAARFYDEFIYSAVKRSYWILSLYKRTFKNKEAAYCFSFSLQSFLIVLSFNRQVSSIYSKWESLYREIVIQMKVASSSFYNCLKQLSYIILYRSLISYIKLQKDIKLSENIIVNLLIFSLEENDLHQTESSSICWQKSIKKESLLLF